MSEKEITALLRSKTGITKRGWRCPDDNQLAAYLNGQALQKRPRLEAHFANCKACLETLAFLSEMADQKSTESVPPPLLVRARSLADEKPANGWRWRWAIATASACLLLVFTFAVWKVRSRQNQAPPSDLVTQHLEPPRSVEVPSPADYVMSRPENTPTIHSPKPNGNRPPVVRGENDQSKPNLIFPRNGAVVQSTNQIRWQPVVDASFYEIKVVSEDGSAVFTKQTSDTSCPLTENELHAGKKYFVTVVAHLNGGRIIKSELVSFRAGP